MSLPSPTTAKQEKPAIKPRKTMQGHTEGVTGILRLPDGQRIITCSYDGSIRVWDLKSGLQVGDAWKDEGSGVVDAIALSPNGKILASGGQGGKVRLWNIETGKVIAKWTGHTGEVYSVCWSPDGGRVVSGSEDEMFRVWDVKSGETILGPIETGSGGSSVDAVGYSVDATMIATGGSGSGIKVWDATKGKLLKTVDIRGVTCLAWISDEKTLITGGSSIRKFDIATWTELAVLNHEQLVFGISLSPNGRILASISDDGAARLWDFENNQSIGPPLYHEDIVRGVAVSADGKILVTGCNDGRIYTWDVSTIVKEVGLDALLSDNVNIVNKSVLNADATRRRAPQIEGARRIPQGFFDDSSTSRGHQTAAPHQPTTPLSWAQNFVSGMLRRRDGSGVRLPPIVEVPLTAGKPRNYHARKKRSATSSQLPIPHTTQQPSGGATQSNLSPSQQPPATATVSTTPPAVTGTAGAAPGTNPDITIRRAGWRARFLLWVCCVPIQNAGGQP